MPGRRARGQLAVFDFPADFEVVERADFLAVADDPDVHGLEISERFSRIAAGREEGGDKGGKRAEDKGHECENGLF